MSLHLKITLLPDSELLRMESFGRNFLFLHPVYGDSPTHLCTQPAPSLTAWLCSAEGTFQTVDPLPRCFLACVLSLPLGRGCPGGLAKVTGFGAEAVGEKQPWAQWWAAGRNSWPREGSGSRPGGAVEEGWRRPLQKFTLTPDHGVHLPTCCTCCHRPMLCSLEAPLVALLSKDGQASEGFCVWEVQGSPLPRMEVRRQHRGLWLSPHCPGSEAPRQGHPARDAVPVTLPHHSGWIFASSHWGPPWLEVARNPVSTESPTVPLLPQLGRYRREKFLALEQADCLANKKGSCPLQLWTTWESRYGGHSGRGNRSSSARFQDAAPRLHGN